MLKALRPLINIALHGQPERLMLLARAYKDEAIGQAKAQAAGAAVTAALGLLGLIFAVIAVIIGFAALYYAVALRHGPLAGFAASGGAAMLIAILMFVIVAIRARSSSQRPTATLAQIKAEAKDSLRRSERATAELGSQVQQQAEALGRRSAAAAEDVMRNGSRETVFGVIAAAALVGVLIGRRG